MNSDDSFQQLAQRLKAADPQAAGEVFGRFSQRLAALARTRLSSRLNAKLDPEDVIQSVFKSFFCRYADGKLDVAGWDSLWNLLVLFTVRKCSRQATQLQAAKRNVRREVSPSDSSDEWAAMDGEPTPEHAAILIELVERLMQGTQPREQQILTMRLQGHTVAEISQQVQRTERTVHRVLRQFSQRLEQLLTEDAE